MGVRGHVDWNARNRLREVEAVVEIEPAKVILVGLALAAVLTDDHARDGFQDLGGPVDRPDAELRGGDRAFAAGRCHTDQAFSGVLNLGQVTKRSRGRDHDVRARRHLHERVGGHHAARRDCDDPANGAEV